MKIPEIKICGITTEEEIAYLNENQVDYAGFVFYEKSKRNISVELAAKLVKKLDPGITPVAVCVSPDPGLAAEIEQNGFAILQVHGILSKEVKEMCRLPIWQAFNIGQLSELNAEELGDGSAILLDSSQFGSGRTFDWSKISEQELKRIRKKKLVLAGGLNASNITEAIRIFQPDVVDVSSGVERDSGVYKDAEKIKEFVRKVRGI